MKIILSIAAMTIVVGASLGAQPSSLGGAIQAGEVGERYDGYLAIVGSPAPQVQRQVSAVNIQRRKLYIELAERRNVTAELVGMATACQLFSRLSVGEAYMQSDGVWHRRAPGQAIALPEYCH